MIYPGVLEEKLKGTVKTKEAAEKCKALCGLYPSFHLRNIYPVGICAIENNPILWGRFKNILYYKKIHFMTAPIKNRLFKVLTVMAMLSTSFIYSCNDTTTKETTTDSISNSTITTPTDSVMKMSPDTTVTDTSGKGSQPTPPRD
ncbi:MAG: hypothetical protein ABIN01_19925 [Ferruginibacter sp.]